MAITEKDKEKVRALAQKVSQQSAKPQTTEQMAITNALAMAQKRGLTPTQTKAGTKAPAFGVPSARTGSRAGVGLSALSSARSFEEYARRRKEQEEADGMRAAAMKLNALYTPGGSAIGDASRTDDIAFVTAKSREREEQAQREAAKAAAEKLAQQYGYKNIAGKVVYATPFSPLPDPRKVGVASKAQAPGAYGIAPVEYAGAMQAISRFEKMQQPETDAETQAFLHRYFEGRIPTAEEFNERYESLYNDFSVPDEEVSYFYHNGAELVGRAGKAQEQYQREHEDAKAGYDAAIALLGEDAPNYLSDREADYYERYRNTYGARQAMANAEPLKYRGYGTNDDMTLAEAKKYTNSPYANQGGNMYDLQRWSQTTQQERNAYQLMRKMYGEEAAENYMQSLMPELNKRLAEAETHAAQEYANVHPVLSSMRSVVTAPVRGAGMLEMGVEKILGRNVDRYDPRLNLTRESEAIRGTVGQNAGAVGGFVYQTGMSILDNLANVALWSGLGGGVSLVSMGLSSGASAFNSAVDRGASENQAFGAALLSGAAEMLFEKASLDNVIKLAKGGGLGNFVGNVLKQMGIDASEELATGIANEISDRLVMGELSNYEQAVNQYMSLGMTEEQARLQAGKDTAAEIGLGALGGALSGGVMGAGGQGIAAMKRMSTERALQETTSQDEETQETAQPEEGSPEPSAGNVSSSQSEGMKTPDVRDALIREYMPDPAQVEAQQADQSTGEQESTPKEKPAEEASEGNDGEMFQQAREATLYDEDGQSSNVRVLGVARADNGSIELRVENEHGEVETVNAGDVDYGDVHMNELMGYGALERMDTKGLRNYLEGYDERVSTAEEYAEAYNSVYMRANAGLDYEQAAMQNEGARRFLTEDARMTAFAAGMNAYNQAHETVQPAIVETMQSDEAPDGAVMSARETAKGGRISRRYSQAAFSRLGKAGRQQAIAQMELLNAIASRTGRTITIVDSIVGRNGQRANAMYDPNTGEIRVALDTQEGAYAYAAMHELTHAMKHEHINEWGDFVAYVKGALKDSGGKNWDELVKYQMDQFGYTRAQAEEEVVCNTVPAILQDERNILKLYKGNRKLFERVVDWVRGMMEDIRAAGEKLSQRSQSWAQMDALAGDRRALQEIYDRMMAVMEKPAEKDAGSAAGKLSAKDEHYDFSQAFEQQVEDLRNGRFPKGDALVISGTPEILQKIGFSKLPLTINQNHLLSMERDTEHMLSSALIRQLPELLKDPVAVIVSETDGENSVVMILKAVINSKPYIAPVYITSTGTSNSARIDSNNIATVFRKGNAVSKLLTDAIKKEHAGEIGVFYWQKSEARDLFESAGVQFPGGSMQDGLNHSIYDAGSPVNREYMDQVQTRQFKRWFGNSQVVNEDGTPKIVYHGTASEFWAFDKKKSNDLMGRRMGLGAGGGKIYLTEYEGSGNAAAYSAQQAGKGKQPKVMELYVSAQKVMDRSEYNRRLNELYARYKNSDPSGEAYDYRQRDKAIAQLDKVIRKEGYDGVWDRDSGELFVYESTQIKSATDNIGTFDEGNPDIRFSLRDTDENVQAALGAEEKAFAQVRGHRITAAEADKLAGTVLKEANSTYDRQKLAAEISRTYDYIERGEDINWNQVDDELTSLMAKVMEKSRTLDLEHEEMAKPIRDYLKNNRISLTTLQQSEAANMGGTYNGYRKMLFGYVRLNNKIGTKLDGLWSDLSDMNSELFPRDAPEGEQPRLLLEAVDALKPVYHNGTGMNVEESANWLAGKLNEAYFNLPAVKAAARDARTFGDSILDLKAAMKRFEESNTEEFRRALQSVEKAREKQERTEWQKKREAMRKKDAAKHEKKMAQSKERELKAKYRAKIERTTKAMANWLLNPTDAKHIPAGVEDSVKAMLAALDFSGKDTKVAATLTERLNWLALSIENAQKGSEENTEGAMYFELDQQMVDEIRRVAEMIQNNTDHQTQEGRGVYDLNGTELKELSKWLDVVRHVISNASKLRGTNLQSYGSVAEVQQMSYTEIRQKKAWKDKKWITKEWEKHFGADMLDSFTFFERLGPTANAVFKELRGGFDQMASHLREAEEFSKTLFEGLDMKKLTGETAPKHKVKLENGNTLEMTKGEIMAIYVLSNREQARGHMYAELNGEGIQLYSDEDPDPNQLTAKDEKNIVDMLTADEKRVAEGMQKFLSKECANWGNETSMKLLGYRKFGEEYYWPIRTDGRTRNSQKLEDTYEANINAIMTQSHTRALVKGAKNAIVIEDIFDTYTKHISNMAAYSAYAMPLSDFNKWYNNTAIKRSIAKVMGPKGEEYIKNLLMAINGTARPQQKTGVEKLMSSMNRNAKTASVGLNARVVIQQPTSFARAAMYMNPKYLTEALVHKAPKAELINKYCGIAQWKDWGFYETNVGPNMKELLTGNMTGMAWLRDKSMVFAAMGDQWTMNRLWVACELETREIYPELAQGSEEYYQQVGKRMSEIIDRTQVVDSVFHRSQMMRSKNWMAQTLTNFMSEPTKTYNMLMGAVYDFADNRKNKAAQKRLSRAFGVWIVTGMLTGAAAAVVDAFRDEEDEKKWLEKWQSAFVSNTFIDNLNPLGMLPLVKDVWSLVQGYSNSNMALQSVQKLIWAYQAVEKAWNGEGTQNWYGVLYKIAQAASSLTGIPVSNVMRDFNGVWQTITGVSLTLKESGRKNQRVSLLYDAMLNGEKKEAENQRSILKTKAGLSDKEIDTALAERLVKDPQVKEAWEAKSVRDYATMNRAKNALTGKGFTGEMVDKAILRYGDSVTEEEEKEKDLDKQLNVALYSNDEVVMAVKTLAGLEKGGSVTEADVRAMLSDRQAASTAADPEKSVKSAIQSELKKDYLVMDAKGDTAGMKKLAAAMSNVLGTEQDTMDGWIKDQHADNLRAAVDKYDSAAARKAVAVMRKDGKSDSDIKSSLSKYKQLYIDAVGRKDTATANKIKTLLKGLGLTGKNGDPLYTDKTFSDWLKK